MRSTTDRHALRRTERRTSGRAGRNGTKILATVALVAAAAAVAGVGTFGAFTDTTTADASVSSARVQILMNGDDDGVSINAEDMRPGSTVVAPITITRGAGTSPIDDLLVESRIRPHNALSDALRLSVDACSVPWTVSVSSVTCSTSSASVVRDVRLRDVQGSTKTWGPSSGWVTKLNAGTPLHLRATLALPAAASNATSGLTTRVSWSLTGTLATGGTTVVTPAGS